MLHTPPLPAPSLQLREEQQKTQKTGSTLSDAGAAADTTRSLLEEIRQAS